MPGVLVDTRDSGVTRTDGDFVLGELRVNLDILVSEILYEGNSPMVENKEIVVEWIFQVRGDTEIYVQRQEELGVY